MLDDPSIEDKGGFEFASGMSIFEEPGVLKANFSMSACTGLPTITSMPRGFATTPISGTLTGFLTVDDKIYSSTDGIAWSAFLTNSFGTIDNIAIYNGYIFYTSGVHVGRCPVNNAAAKTDNWNLVSNALWHPMVTQGGTLKIGHGRYIASCDESFTYTAQAMKVPADYAILTLKNSQNQIFGGTTLGTGYGTITTEDAMTFMWDGIVMSSGTALPNAVYPLSKRGMNLLLNSSEGLFGFPDKVAEIFRFNGANFVPYRQPATVSNATDLLPTGATGCEHLGSILYAGDMTDLSGVFEMKGGAICQSFVPSTINPTSATAVQFGLVGSGFDGKVFITYYAGGSYHVEYLTANRQNNAIMRTPYHRMKTDRMKRWRGIKVNAKPIPAGCFVQVAYRTSRDFSFADSGYVLSAANQDKPVLLPQAPRSREIQWRFTLTNTAAPTHTAELLPYDVLFDPINSLR